MTERPENSASDAEREHLAPVTYLFGGPSREQGEPGRSAARRQESRDQHPAGGWAVPGVTGVSELGDEDDDVDAVPAPEPSKAEKRARNVSVAALARRGMSVAEMRALLTRRELEPALIEEEIATLERSGLLDDSALAEHLTSTLVERKGLGAAAVRSELVRRKLDAETIEIALSSLDGDDEDDRALDMARARARQLSSLDRPTAERRLSGYLQRRGYSGSTLSRAVRTALDESAFDSARAARRGPRFE